MAVIPVGRIARTDQDPLPSTGPHLDVNIIPMYGEFKGQKIDPSLRPELLNRILIGAEGNRRPLTSFPITSGYGPRSAPAPGASTFHPGLDYGVGAGEEVFFQGGRYQPEGQVGVIYTTDSKGNPYELELRHTLLGEAIGDGIGGARMAPPEGPPASKAMAIQASAKERAQNYAAMSKAELDAAYDAGRDSKTGLEMHKAFFNKP